ncbi:MULTISPECIES: type II toxin-antitoxin system RelE/ParE family toxin [unclassified Hymenobacter]|uniref:type II toxin-antitoxin system RelE/ParE family toxin n=1 Tax=unclassified Hymenobacter TaxID=2615202 RepID=UPI001F2F155C|nr:MULTISPECIES: type II toxin-antitoxin system RelE/ParE family toxin [unclassified Hymenobacter]
MVKKYRSLPVELRQLIASLEVTPRQGESLGAGLYKIRLASASKGSGKSGGFRVITYYVEQTDEGETIYLVTIYDKAEAASIAKEELLKLLQQELPAA